MDGTKVGTCVGFGVGLRVGSGFGVGAGVGYFVGFAVLGAGVGFREGGASFLRKQVRLRSHQLLHALPTPSLLHAPASSAGRLVGAARDGTTASARRMAARCIDSPSAEACTLPTRDAGVEKCRSQLLSVISHGVGAIVSFHTMLAADGGLDLAVVVCALH